MDAKQPTATLTLGSLFAGIGGFDIGVEAAGFKTAWQVEIDPTCRAVLQDRFPHARQHEDVRTCLPALTPVDVIVGGFPCQDVSSMGKQRGLAGARTGLFFDAMHIVSTLKPVFSYLKMSPVCCFQTMAATSKQSLKRLPNAGMWDFGACWTAVISESPQNAAAYSWSQVWESCPRWTLWVMPDQWRAYLARRSRAAPGRTLNLRCLQVSPTGQVSTSRVEISSLLPTHGIRWLSGRERLSIMGFAADWMRPTLARLELPETPSVRRSHNG